MSTANGTATTDQNTNDQNANGYLPSDVKRTDIVTQMETAYLDYAMSVIVSRALPDVRDGLKPVHRRILYSMFRDLGLTWDKSHKKSARIVGEVLGKYHPHGDTAVYDAMVRMAQEFSLRYPLVDGQGNFGSIDGDNAAAMRYTEAKLERISNLMLTDIEKDTVGWHENFDSTLQEPDILPAALPNLLINGSSGIAVGMSTNIPPHNLGEVVDALVYMIDNYKGAEKITVEELMQFIKGPDFPTGGILYRFRENKKDDSDTDAIAQGYAMGKSRLILQAKAHFEEMSRNRSRIVVTELPYQTNKTALIERIASLVRDGKLEGITDLRDESDRTGMRICIELTRNVEPKMMLAQLFKLTPLQQTFGMQALALVEGEPITLGLRRMLFLFLEHRQEIIRRRSEYDLKRAKERAHIVEGLLRALDILDEVIACIRRSQRVDTARDNLVKEFKFSKIQAQAILDMQLRRLAALERRKLEDEYKELMKLIKYLEGLLASPKKVREVIKQELLEQRDLYADQRRTQIVERTKGTLTTTDLLPDQEVWVSVGKGGTLRRQAVSKVSTTTLRQTGKAAEVGLITANTQDWLYLFGRDGRCRRVSIHEIPQGGASRHLADLTEFTRRDTVNAALALPQEPINLNEYLFLVTVQGMVKRITVGDFVKSAPMDPLVMSVDNRDELGWVLPTKGGQEIMLVTDGGQSIRFTEDDVRSMGLGAAGVSGMRLKKGQKLVHAGVINSGDEEAGGELLTVTKKGFAKRTKLEEYSSQGRNGGGVVAHKLSAKTGDLATALIVDAATIAREAFELVAIIPSKGAAKPIELTEISQLGRSVLGKMIAAIGPNDDVAAIKQLCEGSASPPSLDDPDDDNGSGGSSGGPKTSAKSGSRSNGSGAPKPSQPKLINKGKARSKTKAEAKAKTAANSPTVQKSATISKRGKAKAEAKTTVKPTAQKSAAGATRVKAAAKSTTAQKSASAARRSKAVAAKSESGAKPAETKAVRTKATAKPAAAKAAPIKLNMKKAPVKKTVAKAPTAQKATAAKSATKQATSSKTASSKTVSPKSTSAKSTTAKSTNKSTSTPTTKKRRATASVAKANLAAKKSTAKAKTPMKQTTTAKSTPKTATKRASKNAVSATKKKTATVATSQKTAAKKPVKRNSKLDAVASVTKSQVRKAKKT